MRLRRRDRIEEKASSASDGFDHLLADPSSWADD
jgi:hypothetical protein